MAKALPLYKKSIMEVFNWDAITVLVKITDCNRNCLMCMLRDHSLRWIIKYSISPKDDLKSPSMGGGIECNLLATQETGSVLPPAKTCFSVLGSIRTAQYPNPSRGTD